MRRAPVQAPVLQRVLADMAHRLGPAVLVYPVVVLTFYFMSPTVRGLSFGFWGPAIALSVMSVARTLISISIAKRPPDHWDRRATILALLSILSSAAWGGMIVDALIELEASPTAFMLLMCTAGTSAAGLLTIGQITWLFAVHVILQLTPVLVVGLWLVTEGRGDPLIPIAAGLYAGYLLAGAPRYARDYWNHVESRYLLELKTLALDKARRRAEAVGDAKSEFLAAMSHEIRTPMNGILGAAELLDQSELRSEQRELVETLMSSGHALLRIINDILDLSKIEAGRVQLDPSEFDLRACVEDVADILGPVAHGQGLELDLHFGEDLPQTVEQDSGRLRQVLLNLANNAIKFTDTGSVAIDVRRAADVEPCTVRFEIRDTGCGIPDDEKDKLFTLFCQVRGRRSREGGTGLGLAICQRLVTLMGGQIGFESTEGAGSTFWFEIPFAHATPASDPRLFGPTVWRGPTAVVARRTPSRESLVATMRSVGLTPASYDSVAAAADHLGDPNALVVLDTFPPQVLDEWPNESRCRLLAAATLAERARLLEGFADAVLVRPVKRARLRTVLHRFGTTDAPPVPQCRAQTPSPEGRRVLVVEDNEVNQMIARRYLERAGYLCCIAGSGEAALEVFAKDRQWHAILMDCQMPGIDGFETTRRIREAEAIDGTHVHIIAMTAHASDVYRQRCLTAGMDDYLTKPIRLQVLTSALDSQAM